MMSLWNKFCKALRAYRIAHGGNVAITFALATLPIITTVGFAVDYSRANAVKTALQSALDSTALMLSKEASTDTSTQLSANAQKYFTALFTSKDAKNIQTGVSYGTSGGSSIIISASADVPTYLLGLLPGQMFQNLTVSSTATAKWGVNRLRVALVLDNTGSMDQSGKMTALKAATAGTGGLLSQLQAAVSTNGDVYVSIIPFVKDVNIGGTNYSSNYIYWGTAPADNNVNNPLNLNPIQDSTSSDNTSWNATNGQCEDQGGTVLGTSSSYKARSSCLTKSSCSIPGNITQNSCTNAGTCSVSGFTSQSTCTGAGTCSVSGNTTQSTCTAAGTCSISGHNSQNSCTGAGTCSISGHNSQNGCTGAGVCSNSQYTTSNQCGQHNGTWTAGVWTAGVWTAATWTATPGTWTGGVWSTATTQWVPYAHNDPTHGWNGCVVDRGGPTAPDTGNYDTNVVSPDTTINATLYAAEQYSSCPKAVKDLSYDWTGMNDLVNSMSSAGNTNQAIGLQLGWMSLVGGGPFPSPPAFDAGYNYTQAVILLTDGLNTQDRWYSSQNSIDTRQQTTCNNLNAAGITVYTIQVNTGGDPTSTLLQNCAGSPGHYPDPTKFFLLTSASQIVTAFNSIATNLTQLRVAR